MLSMVQMFTEEERKNKYASLYNRSTFVVASIHSLVFDTTSESAYVTKNIESHCPNVLVPFMFCAAVSSRNASSLVLDLLSSAINKQQAFFSQSQR